jgi:hypothetical protein
MTTKAGAVIEQPKLQAESEIVTVPAVRQPAAVAQLDVDESVSMFERLARDPNVDVEKIERLIAMQERMMANRAKSAFDEAFAALQGDMPVVIEGGTSNTGKYARLEDIQKTVRPVLKAHGFAISFKTEWPDAKTVKVVGILTHKEGHQRTSEFLSAADSSGSKNAIQGLGSAVAYGRRYTTLDLLNITTSEKDDDGSGTDARPDPPSGFSRWLTDFEATADNGWDALQKAWHETQSAKPEHCTYLTKYGADKLAAIKAKAKKVKA